MIEHLKGTNTLAYFSPQSVAMRVFIMLAPCVNDSGTVWCSTSVVQTLDYAWKLKRDKHSSFLFFAISRKEWETLYCWHLVTNYCYVTGSGTTRCSAGVVQILDYIWKLQRDKHSSLLFSAISHKERDTLYCWHLVSMPLTTLMSLTVALYGAPLVC